MTNEPPTLQFAMSNDFLSSEASSVILSGAGKGHSPDAGSSLLDDERDLSRSFRSNHRLIDASVRKECVLWIIKVQQYYEFQPLTAYLAVNYFDRFIQSHYLPKMNGWPMQLLTVACLSVAAKMEEPQVPSLLDLEVEDAKFIFEPRTIQRMELVVLRVLDWRLRSVSPFCYLNSFALKIDPTRTHAHSLVTRSKQFILETIRETSFLEYSSSCIATAAIQCASDDLIPKLSCITNQNAESWCEGLHKDELMSCQELIRKIVFRFRPGKQRMVSPQPRETSNSSPSDSSSPPPPPSSTPSSYKRRKLNNNNSRAEDEKEDNCDIPN